MMACVEDEGRIFTILHASSVFDGLAVVICEYMSLNDILSVELVKATYSYKAENPDELEMEEGDIITILDKKSTDEGWWKGKLNGKIGVFPNNFVVAHGFEDMDDKVDSGKTKSKVDQVAKPARPLVVNKTPPPLPLTAKPNANKPKTLSSQLSSPPRLVEPVKLISKPSLKSVEAESENITFDSSSTHKPLVGPTAERVRRQNIRPPKKIIEMNANNEEDIVSPEKTKVTTPRDRSVDDAPLENHTAKTASMLRSTIKQDKVEKTEITFPDTKPGTTTTAKTTALKEKFSDNSPAESATKFVSVRDRSKEITDTTDYPRKSKFTQDKSKESPPLSTSEVTASKLSYRPKSQMFGGSYQLENDNLKIFKTDDPDLLKRKIIVLESKISAVEEDNLLLRKEMVDLTKSNNDQITNLTAIVNKLSADFDDEKIKRKASDLKLQQLHEFVDDMDLS